MSMTEIQEAAEVITNAVSPDANIIFGASIRPELGDEIAITVVATGFDSEYYQGLANADQGVGFDEPDVTSEQPVNDVPQAPTVDSADFAAENNVNIWDSIKTTKEEDDLDVPPSLRNKLRGKKTKE